MDCFKKWAQKEFSFWQRFLATLLAGVIFVFLIPFGLVVLAPRLDQRLLLSPIPIGNVVLVISALMILFGFVFAMWSIFAQLLFARGTPLPMMATQELLVSGPFRYCRNPMSLGTILIYVGISLLIRSWSALGIAVIISGLLIVYLKRIEERELEMRFGDTYLEYKKKTPFLIPKFPQR